MRKLTPIVLLFVLFTTGSAIPTHHPAPAAGLTVYWIDTEGGGATLIVTPAGESILIDAGNPGGRDAGRIYEVAHNVAGLQQIDHLLITHWHIDHFGGAAEVASKIPVIELIDKGIPDSLKKDERIAAQLKPYEAIAAKQHTLLKPGSFFTLKDLPRGFQKLSLQLVGADKHFVPVTKAGGTVPGCDTIRAKAIDLSDNANSQVLVMNYGSFRFFDGGDLTWNLEKNLVCPVNIIGTVDVFQVNHHGLDQSNNPLLIRALAPTVSVMGNGTSKGGGPETITSLRNTPSIKAQFQLHKNIRTDSSFNTEPANIANLTADCKGNYVKMTVSADGKKYTISIPATGVEKSFDTKATH